MGSRGSRFHQWMLEALRSMGLGAHCGLLLKYEALGPEQRARECLRLHHLLRGDGGGALEAEAGAQGPPARPAPVRRDFKASFAATAATHADTATASVRVLEEEQGSAGWHRARTRERQSLWEEKIGLTPPFPGNAATRWGSKMEAAAMETYVLKTGNAVSKCSFATKRDDPAHDWIGASPDGLVEARGDAAPGLVEIKCPFNRGRPDLAVPPEHAIWYYMPQVQGQMEMLDREWCDLFVWTPARGAAAFRIERDREFWAAAYDVLAEFWWAHVVPARQIQERGARSGQGEESDSRTGELLLDFLPGEHEQTEALIERSMRMAELAPRLIALLHIPATMTSPIILENARGTRVEILPLGAIIQRLWVADRDGKLDDVVLGFDTETPYKDGSSPYFGAVVGRVANRIANGTFELDGVTYKLHTNNGPNTLHGGLVGFDKREFRVKSQEPGSSVELQYVSPNGEEEFPGSVTVDVRYELTDDNRLRVLMRAVADRPTPINLAQHTYWNLAGHDKGGDVLDHLLVIHGEHYTPVNEVQIPTGEIAPVKGTPFDFTTEHAIGDRINDVPGGYDHNYVLFGLGPEAREKVKHGAAFTTPKEAILLEHKASGRGLKVSTTAPGVQFYSGNFLDGTLVGKGGARYAKHGGLALETQGFPDAINQPSFPSIVLRPGEEYVHELVYEFFTV
ncbi:hypothetical protein QBZ16_001165 [Prototheca wickerhamii]|uniref:YqaJ viral recombinase domain-containing protein n=1 Tax=Prototheca wickerhamii TaxID=3111 RepID=A0AAD9MKE8_PROWI|nr:hypothetical protein QBZ16_001165 [Prototheca wickerhamii]